MAFTTRGLAFMSKLKLAALAAIGLLGISAVAAQAADTIKIAANDPFSGGNGNVGDWALQILHFEADAINQRGGVDGKKLEIIGLDNKNDAHQAILQAQKAIGQGARVIAQGISGSSVGAALKDFIEKYNERNPGKEVLYLNYAANGAAQTNEGCSYWHFRFSSNTDMKTKGLVSYLATRPDIKKVYLVNPDFSEGQEVAAAAVQMLHDARPDIQIVGNDLHPMLSITDFSPYVAKIRASGADAVLTSDFAQDIALLLKAAGDAGLKVDWLSFYANNPGGTTALVQAGLSNKVFNLVDTFANNPPNIPLQVAFRAKYGHSMMVPGAILALDFLAAAMTEAHSEDIKAVAANLEGLSTKTFNNTTGVVRKEDHQLIEDIYLTTLGPVTKESPLDEEKTGWGWLPVKTIAAADTEIPSTCHLKRP
jgi:branched-chain amino acid transport system substrate-binding protein